MVIYEDNEIISIATGLDRASKNPKTGQVIHIWILNKNLNPIEASKTGADWVVCGDCPLRPSSGGGCYVNLAWAPMHIWRKFHRRDYPSFDLEAFRGKFVRFGAYGEPILLPIDLVAKIAEVSSGWTGYTHQWRKAEYQPYRQYFMASCNREDYFDARNLGWRAFIVSQTDIPNVIHCPASLERGFKLDCKTCGLCCGISGSTMRSIQIRPHGNGKRRLF